MTSRVPATHLGGFARLIPSRGPSELSECADLHAAQLACRAAHSCGRGEALDRETSTRDACARADLPL